MEYDVLGLKLKLKPEGNEDAVTPDEVVAFVRREALVIKEKNPRLSDGQVATLLALELSKRLLSLEREYCQSVENFRQNAVDALSYIDQVSPSL